MVTREMIRDALTRALLSSDAVLAFFEGGSLAMGRADEWSDLDLQVVVRDGFAEAAQGLIEGALRSLGTIDVTYELPRPTWHGHLQVFYRLAESDPLWLIDLLIIEEKSTLRFLEPELHGTPAVYIDRAHMVTGSPTDAEPLARILAQRIAALQVIPELFHRFVDKEVRRGRPLDALAAYDDLLQKAVEALRILHCPWRYNFGIRYLQSDLPPTAFQKVLKIAYPTSPEDLLRRKDALLSLLEDTTKELVTLDLVQHLEATREHIRP